jgi:hypothetical protein
MCFAAEHSILHSQLTACETQCQYHTAAVLVKSTGFLILPPPPPFFVAIQSNISKYCTCHFKDCFLMYPFATVMDLRPHPRPIKYEQIFPLWSDSCSTRLSLDNQYLMSAGLGRHLFRMRPQYGNSATFSVSALSIKYGRSKLLILYPIMMSGSASITRSLHLCQTNQPLLRFVSMSKGLITHLQAFMLTTLMLGRNSLDAHH